MVIPLKRTPCTCHASSRRGEKCGGGRRWPQTLPPFPRCRLALTPVSPPPPSPPLTPPPSSPPPALHRLPRSATLSVSASPPIAVAHGWREGRYRVRVQARVRKEAARASTLCGGGSDEEEKVRRRRWRWRRRRRRRKQRCRQQGRRRQRRSRRWVEHTQSLGGVAAEAKVTRAKRNA